jgi:hypothetical protein
VQNNVVVTLHPREQVPQVLHAPEHVVTRVLVPVLRGVYLQVCVVTKPSFFQRHRLKGPAL